MSSEPDVASESEWGAVDRSNRPYPTAESTTPSVTTPSVETVLETVLGLREKELSTYEAIRAEPEVSMATLADRLDRDRSNINRSVIRLVEVGLVTRQRRISDTGGYYYVNYAAPTAVLRELVDDALDRWVAEARSAVADYQREATQELPTDS